VKNLGYYVGAFISLLGIVLIVLNLNEGKMSFGVITLCMGAIIIGITYSANKKKS